MLAGALLLLASIRCDGCTRTAGNPCRSSAECIAGEACFEKICRVACSSDGDCESGLRCANEVCLLVGGPCHESGDCLASERCIDQLCRQLCADNADCPPGATCQESGTCMALADAAVRDAVAVDRVAGDAERDGGERDRFALDALRDRPLGDVIGHESGRDQGPWPDVQAHDTWQSDNAQSDNAQPDRAQLDQRQPDMAGPDLWQPDTNQPDLRQPDTRQPDTSVVAFDASQPDTYQPQQRVIMREHFNDADIDSRWTVREDSCGVLAAGTVSHNTDENACGNPAGYAYRLHMGDRCIFRKTAFDTAGYSDVHLKYSVRIDGNANLRVYVRRSGSWVEVAYHDTYTTWTAFDWQIDQPFTNVRFDFISPVEGAERRLDCVSVTGWQ